jgi:hypothetical protein
MKTSNIVLDSNFKKAKHVVGVFLGIDKGDVTG